MKDNIVTIDWTDEVIAKTCLTHAGKLTKDAPKPNKSAGATPKPPAKPSKPAVKAA